MSVATKDWRAHMQWKLLEQSATRWWSAPKRILKSQLIDRRKLQLTIENAWLVHARRPSNAKLYGEDVGTRWADSITVR